ncbi:MAG TPA: hypothetical protein VFM32_05790 [Spongiibacteraceae bacterium]|nr:hypothetical protein [Spongiibacteraceae bacterium]
MDKEQEGVVVQDNGQVKHPMVGWYDPGQLIQTAISVVVSTLFGRHADFRQLEALSVKSEIHRFDNPGDGGFWFDYTADVGDGWNSSYAVAYHLAQPTLTLRAENGGEYRTERGKILLFGGDEVYPVASRAAYQQKLVQCYDAALSLTPEDQSPTVFAIPGNHDWYDSLVAFMRLFCSGRWFGGWRTVQQASYFAVKLPRGWWLIATDIQLDSDIDEAQVKFLRSVAEQMQDSDRIVLCVAEPHWIYAKTYGISDKDYNESNLAFIEQKIFKRKIAAYVAGDLHHYRRHAAPDGVQKITAGGGGAFLHPTHGQNVATLADGFKLEACFPDQRTSRRLTWRNLLFPIWNPTFGVVTGILYLLTGWATHLDLSPYALCDIKAAFFAAFNKVLNEPLAAFWITLVFMGFFLFTDTHSKRYRYIAGSVHGAAHLLALFGLGWLISVITTGCLALPFGSTPQMLAAGVLIFAGGWALGSMIMGLYLLVSLNGFKRHGNEAFSSLKIQDWKNFLRCKIASDGSLTIFAIGLRRVPRKWKKVGAPGTRSCIVPDDKSATMPELIDQVVLL